MGSDAGADADCWRKAGFLILQIFLSRSESKWSGLILPAITFMVSLIALLSVAAFEDVSFWSVMSVMLIAFISYNIPTVIFLGIYAACRSRRRKKKEYQMNKMNIQDL